jgi:hypothetical protein
LFYKASCCYTESGEFQRQTATSFLQHDFGFETGQALAVHHPFGARLGIILCRAAV